jgi:hypothetical protein
MIYYDSADRWKEHCRSLDATLGSSSLAGNEHVAVQHPCHFPSYVSTRNTMVTCRAVDQNFDFVWNRGEFYAIRTWPTLDRYVCTKGSLIPYFQEANLLQLLVRLSNPQQCQYIPTQQHLKWHCSQHTVLHRTDADSHARNAHTHVDPGQ